jgi:hypothetical protein
MALPIKGLNFPKIILPFALASCLAFLFSGFFSGFEGDDVPFTLSLPLISAAEYQAHAEYQRRFSLMPLGQGGFDEASYFHYDVGKDGLIVKAESPEELGLAVIPPFPLESLMEFMGNPNPAGDTRDMNVFELIPVLLVLLLCIPAMSGGGRGRGKKKGRAIYNDKRIAA